MTAREEGLRAGWAEEKRRAPERARDERYRDVGRRPSGRPWKTRPREGEQAHRDRGQAGEGGLHRESLHAVVQLLKVHQEDGEAVGREHVVVEGRRARRIDVGRHDEAGAREGRTGRREREDRYREKAAHPIERIRLAFACGWCQR
jgi:hypothetical protein